jgi:hypothetical protein
VDVCNEVICGSWNKWSEVKVKKYTLSHLQICTFTHLTIYTFTNLHIYTYFTPD